MISDKIKKLVDSLYMLTEKGSLIWKEQDPNSKKRFFERRYTTTGEDLTIYEIDIKYSLKGNKWSLESDASLWIRNKNLPNGSYYAFETNINNYGISKLKRLIMDLYCSDMNPSISDIEDIFEDMVNGINISVMRDNKIESIINSK